MDCNRCKCSHTLLQNLCWSWLTITGFTEQSVVTVALVTIWWSYRCLCQRHSSGEKHMWEDKLSERQIRGWGAVSAAGLQGKGSRKSSFSRPPDCDCSRLVMASVTPSASNLILYHMTYDISVYVILYVFIHVYLFLYIVIVVLCRGNSSQTPVWHMATAPRPCTRRRRAPRQRDTRALRFLLFPCSSLFVCSFKLLYICKVFLFPFKQTFNCNNHQTLHKYADYQHQILI